MFPINASFNRSPLWDVVEAFNKSGTLQRAKQKYRDLFQPRVVIQVRRHFDTIGKAIWKVVKKNSIVPARSHHPW